MHQIQNPLVSEGAWNSLWYQHRLPLEHALRIVSEKQPGFFLVIDHVGTDFMLIVRYTYIYVIEHLYMRMCQSMIHYERGGDREKGVERRKRNRTRIFSYCNIYYHALYSKRKIKYINS